MFSSHLTTSIKSDSDQDVTTYPTGICFSVSLSPIFSSNHIWIVDSGATRHICSKASAFVCINEVKHATVTLPDHTQIPVHFSGDVKLSSMITLKNVLFVPQFKFNLISVSALVSDSHLTVKFLPDCFIIQDLGTKRMIGRGDKCEELYVLNTKILNSVSNAFVNHVSAHVWHNRLGHISFKRLERLKDQLHCDVSRLHKAEPCYVYPLAKQRRLSFESSNNMSVNPFDLVHCDIWGPYPIASFSCDDVSENLVDPRSFPTPVSPVTETPINAPVLRRSERPIQRPSYLQNYHCSLLTHSDMTSASTSYPVSKYVSYHILYDAHRHFVLTVSSQHEPQFYHQAVQFPQWRAAMTAELDAMESNHTCWFTFFVKIQSINEKFLFFFFSVSIIRYQTGGLSEQRNDYEHPKKCRTESLTFTSSALNPIDDPQPNPQTPEFDADPIFSIPPEVQPEPQS
ncbi:hypothetical protein LWI28_013676 [Acer negundo]|uniref:GAG-pre-integrase domain-containing protein n=1 Tax=Acer negundo TaxID=4023 RepID=A0AAD5JFR6_ACENE|nr:hypothetical protein LWI28_013676 [Acer negundo]